MLWLKRNLAWGLALLVAVVLTGTGGFYIWSGKSRNDDLTQKLGAAKAELNRLTTEVNPSPTPDNVRAAKEDVRKSQEYATLARKLFVATPVPPLLTSQTYRSMLETNLAALRRLAAVSGVEIPTNYSFSFEPETRQLTFLPANLKPLAEQLVEIGEVSEALFKARVHHLTRVRRVETCQYDAGSSEILQGVGISSNRFTGLWVWPYEFAFECFSSELAAALQELNRIPRMVVLKTIRVESEGRTTSRAQALPTPNAPPPTPPRGGARWRRPGMPPAAAPGAAAPKPAATLTTVLEEGLLKVVIEVDVIKPAR